ncbi:MAG TPA: hypothetical protein EYP30_08215 [Archaeoglobaceae archaeon]|nr:hypothetical protein [Archaeoglobaceae archaeon]
MKVCQFRRKKIVCSKCGKENCLCLAPQHEVEETCVLPPVSGENFCEIHLQQSRELIQTGALSDITSPISRIGIRAILKCPCANYLHSQKRKKEKIENLFDCRYVGKFTDPFGDGRCVLEILLFNSLWDRFTREYELDPIADALALERLIISIIRVNRLESEIALAGEKVFVPVYSNGKLIYEIKDHYFNSALASLDARMEKWLNSLKLARRQREASKLEIELDWSKILSDEEE